MRIIFLDFDGVLISHESFRRKASGERAAPTPETVAAMNHLLQTTNANIVVSSVWRLGRPKTWLQCVLDGWGIKGRVIDSTPELHEPREVAGQVVNWHRQRGHEIQAWLDGTTRPWREDVDSLVIIDDDSDMVHLAPYLVQTEFERGFQMEHAERAIAMLRHSAAVRQEAGP